MPHFVQKYIYLLTYLLTYPLVTGPRPAKQNVKIFNMVIISEKIISYLSNIELDPSKLYIRLKMWVFCQITTKTAPVRPR